MFKFLSLINFDNLIKSSGFAVFVMFAMMTAMAYTLWQQYNRTNDRLTKLEQEVFECYKENSIKNQLLIERNTEVMERVIYKLENDSPKIK
jgi:hypothetical protein